MCPVSWILSLHFFFFNLKFQHFIEIGDIRKHTTCKIQAAKSLHSNDIVNKAKKHLEIKAVVLK